MCTFEAEAVNLLSNLIQIDTTNPPGNELAAVQYLAAIARQNDLDVEIIETAPGRGNLLVKLPGHNPDLPPLILLSHLDVVPADPVAWQIPPFSGQVQDGIIWGRGAVDTKQLTVMQFMALLQLKRSGLFPQRDVILAATADEECGSRLGLAALLETHGRLFRDADVVSEGGGFPIRVGNQTIYLCESGQKGPCTVRFSCPKQAGGNPYFPNLNGVQAASELILRLEGYRWPGEIPEMTRRLLERLATAAGITESLPPDDLLAQLAGQISPALHKVLTAMTQNTMAVTVWKGGRRSNLPGFDSELLADVRLLPGVGRGDLEERLNELTAGLPVAWELIKYQPGYEASAESALFQALAGALENRLPGAQVAPFLSSGASDGRLLQSHGARVYGFSPVLLEDMTFDQAITMVHGVDERISVASLIFGTEVLYAAVVSLCQEKMNEKP
ncbi:MAG TPA: M20/M25/M40 family metallo-hydrolase [Anaerolineaceae bacterium]|nr:M20/M25/M40 family metallo-hydrolase [Anaerolineaceae bacterium]